MKLACVFTVVAAFALQMSASAAVIDPYVDSVVEYNEGTNVLPPHDNPIEALGAPDGGPGIAGGYLSLGNGGSAIFQFTDNLLVDGPGNDLYLTEIGNNDTYQVAISNDNINYYIVGTALNSSGFQISSIVAATGITSFSYVRVVDSNAQLTPSPYAGVDIDSIEALNTIPVPEPASFAMLSLASLGFVLRRK